MDRADGPEPGRPRRRPRLRDDDVSEAQVKHGQICTNGLGCATGGDRSLGDFLQVSTDAQGAALVSYVFDTSADSSAGEDAGPEAISRQISGPSLLAAAGPSPRTAVPVRPGHRQRPDGRRLLLGQREPHGRRSDLDLTGASLANGARSHAGGDDQRQEPHQPGAASGAGGPDA